MPKNYLPQNNNPIERQHKPALISQKFQLASLILLVVMLIPALPTVPLVQARMRSSASVRGSLRVLNVKTIEMTHPLTGENGIALAVKCVLYDLADENLIMSLWSASTGNIGYAYPLTPTDDEERFLAVLFIPARSASSIDINNLEIHLCDAKSKRLVQSLVISSDRYN